MLLTRDAKIYIAGHSGLVGSAILRNLQARGFTRLLTRRHAELDLLDPVATREFFDQESPDVVVLAAAHVGGIVANDIYRADFIYNNLQIQQNVIGESFRHGVRRLLFLGSTCIYPREAAQPIREEYLLSGPLEYTNEPYAIAKIAGLKLCESLNLQYGTDYIAVMPTNLYGPHDNFDLINSHVLPAMMRKIHLAKLLQEEDYDTLSRDLSARPVGSLDGTNTLSEIRLGLASYGIAPGEVTLWGSGTPLREFLWSEDMADAAVHLLLYTSFRDLYAPDATEIRNCHINIGTGSEISIRDLGRKIAHALHFDGLIHWDTSKPDGTPRKLTCVDKLHSLGWHHRVDLDEGIARLYQWYSDSIGAATSSEI